MVQALSKPCHRQPDQRIWSLRDPNIRPFAPSPACPRSRACPRHRRRAGHAARPQHRHQRAPVRPGSAGRHGLGSYRPPLDDRARRGHEGCRRMDHASRQARQRDHQDWRRRPGDLFRGPGRRHLRREGDGRWRGTIDRGVSRARPGRHPPSDDRRRPCRRGHGRDDGPDSPRRECGRRSQGAWGSFGKDRDTRQSAGRGGRDPSPERERQADSRGTGGSGARAAHGRGRRRQARRE